ncbi:MAG: hypothetical protein JST93_12035 [Acidobacteria bacterium]|nr:hypothetical protein [Acidobacteriota bacterium]
MIPLVLLLLSIESGPDGEARIRLTPERPVALLGGELVVELDEAVFGEITGFAVPDVSGSEAAVALIEGRRIRVSFGSRASSLGMVAERPLLTLRAQWTGSAPVDAVKVTGTGAKWRVAEGGVPEDLPEESFVSVTAGRYQIQLPKQRLTAGEGGPFRAQVPGGVAVRNPQPHAVDVLYQNISRTRDVRSESRFTLAAGESRFIGVSLDYGRILASAPVEMGDFAAGPLTRPYVQPVVFSAAGALRWYWQAGTDLPAVTMLSLTAPDAPTLRPEFAVSTTANWLRVTRDGMDLLVTADPRGLAAGVYRDAVTVTPVGDLFFTAGAPLVIGATLTVSDEPEQRVSFVSRSFPQFHLERFPVSGAYAASVYPADAPGRWLTVIPGGGFFADTVSVASNGDLLGPGYYAGHVVLRGAKFTDVIQVTTMVAGAPLIESTSAVRFVMSVGGKAPEAQRLPVQAPGRYVASVRTDNGGDWLTMVQEAGAITLGVNAAGLKAGAYTGLVTLTAAGAAGPRQIPVALLVYAQPVAALVADPAALELRVTEGSQVGPQRVQVTSGLHVEGLQWSVEMDGGGTWLSREAVGEDAWVQGIRMDLLKLPVGVYTGRVIARTSMQSVVVPVRVVVAGPAAVVPYLGTVTNAASRRAAPLAPGEFVYLFGDSISTVRMDGIALADLVVPPELAGRREVTLRLESLSGSVERRVTLAEAAPGVFTVDGSGKGFAAVRNADGVWNYAKVRRGSVVWLAVTGVKADDVWVDVGGARVRAMNVFPAVEGKAGRDWVEFVVPAEAPVGEVPVVVVSAGVRSQSGVTLYVE